MLHPLCCTLAIVTQDSKRPEVVEMWDVTAADPKLLVHLKSYRCTVPVPRHWSQKRAYLAGKRGLEKPAFKLPDYIEATGSCLRWWLHIPLARVANTLHVCHRDW